MMAMESRAVMEWVNVLHYHGSRYMTVAEVTVERGDYTSGQNGQPVEDTN
ncbi:MAG: hypothetical protein ACYCYO_22090 [Bacilli bacterium]